ARAAGLAIHKGVERRVEDEGRKAFNERMSAAEVDSRCLDRRGELRSQGLIRAPGGQLPERRRKVCPDQLDGVTALRDRRAVVPKRGDDEAPDVVARAYS